MAAALAGCAKIENVPMAEKQVSFSVGSYAPDTKASSVLGEFTSFQSRGFLHAEGVSGTQAFFGESGETIQWYPATQEWAPASHPYFWPKSDNSYVNFVSWYDNAGNPATVSETELAWGNRTIGATDNILFADEAWRFNGNAQTYQFDGVAEGVPTLFHHALAKVAVRAIAKTLVEGSTTWEVKVTGISISNVFKAGALNLRNSDPSTATTTKAWTSPGGTAPEWTLDPSSTDAIAASGEWTLANQLAGGDYTTIIDSQSVLPQTITSGMVMTISYTVKTIYDSSHYVKENVTTTVALSDFTTSFVAWEMNKIITYSIVIDPATDLILFDPDETDWTVMPETDVVID